MTSARYLACLKALHLSQRGVAPLLGCSDRLPREWATGVSSVPPKIGVWLEACVALRERKPKAKLYKAPPDWRRHETRTISHQGNRLPLPDACAAIGTSVNRLRYHVDRYGISWQAAFNRAAAKLAKKAQNNI